MSGTTTSGSTATSDGILVNITPVSGGGELEVNGSAALVDASGHTVALGKQAYRVGDILGALVSAATTPVTEISAAGVTKIVIPTSGDAMFLVTPSAASVLQFSGSAAAGASQILRLLVVGNGNAVELPTSGVVYPDGTIPTVSTEAGDLTVVDYLVASGASAIVGGV